MEVYCLRAQNVIISEIMVTGASDCPSCPTHIGDIIRLKVSYIFQTANIWLKGLWTLNSSLKFLKLWKVWIILVLDNLGDADENEGLDRTHPRCVAQGTRS